MTLLRTHELTLQFGAVTIFDALQLALNENDKIGLIGANGAGKSSFLKILAQKIPATTGSVSLQPGIQIGYLAQEMEDPGERTIYEEILTAFSEVQAMEPKLRQLEIELTRSDLSSDEKKRLAHEYDELQELFRVLGGYEMEERVKQVLTRLNLPPSSWTQPVKTFSGGEKNLIGIAKLMVRRPHIFLFDEPSNHLDAQGIEWFIRFLQNDISCFLLVSHNRYLLDQCTNQIWELHRGKVKIYTGNYSAYRKKKQEDLELQIRLYKTQQNAIERLQFQARRLKDMAKAYNDPGQAKRAKSMEKRIERMDVVEKPETDSKKIGIRLNSSERHGLIALDVKNFSLQLGDRVLLDQVSFQIQYQERVCLAGPNGSGKTTLFKAIIDEGNWENQVLRIGKSAKVGYYSQMHDILMPNLSLVENVRELGQVNLSEAKTLLFRFLFQLDDLERKVSTLSGGEKSRVQLAIIMGQGVNFLLLDEPTNHLDILSCEIIEDVLEAFEGTLFIISHDRYFLNRIVQRVIAIEEDGQIKDYPMDFETYWATQERQERNKLLLPSQKQAIKKKNASLNSSPLKDLQKEQRRYSSRAKQLEQEIEKMEKEKERISQQTEEAYSLQNIQEGTKLAAQLNQLGEQLVKKYQEWEENLGQAETLQEQIEAL